MLLCAPTDFHLHEAPVPEDGDCMGTGGHLDPYERTASPPCDASAPETCEVGDLSGKYGRLDGESGEIRLVLFLSSFLNGFLSDLSPPFFLLPPVFASSSSSPLFSCFVSLL